MTEQVGTSRSPSSRTQGRTVAMVVVFRPAAAAMLDPFAARTMRDTPADLISVKIGISIAERFALRAFSADGPFAGPGSCPGRVDRRGRCRVGDAGSA
ncbi:hypothetical protein [Micromonospora ureilytica]|uniref:hypothetical protein n=1 Tax=Micromonospora ureilytica TaxID=709868 RepID=UPI004039755D